MSVLTPADMLRMLGAHPRILIVEDDAASGQGLRLLLQQEGYDTGLATTGTEGLKKIREEGPYDLILLDVVMPGLDGWGVLSEVRGTPATARLPVIMLTAMAGDRDEVEMLEAGADDYISKPFRFDMLLAHVEAVLRRSVSQTVNPLTGLPGNPQVERFLQRCVMEQESFWACAYIDIDNFKAYNDCYGFLQGDEVLKKTAGLISVAADSYRRQAFVGNIGGDDFLLGFASDMAASNDGLRDEVRRILVALADEFDRTSRGFYSDQDAARGYVEAEGRRGEVERYPLMSLSIAVVTSGRRTFNHPLEISSAFASVKRRAKLQPGSAVCFDQRR